MNLKFLQSAFDRLGQDGDKLEQIAENTAVTAEAVVAGGELFDRIDRMMVALEKIETSTKAGQGGIQDAIVLKLVAPTLKPIGLGMQFIIDALNSLPDANEASEKLKVLTEGLVALGDVGKSILLFAGYMILATPLLLVTAVLAPIWMGGLYLIIRGLMAVTDRLDEKRLDKIAMLGDVGKSLLVLAGSLALVALISPLAVVGLLASAIMILGIVGIFKLVEMIGADEKKIQGYGDALKSLGLGLLATGLSLALISLIAGPIIKGLGVAILMIAGISLLFYALDTLDVEKKMKKTSIALMFAGLAIVVLAASVLLASVLIPPLAGLLSVLAVVGGVALLFYVAGMGATQILKGALALGVAGLALIILGFGVSIMAKAVPDLKTGLGMLAIIGGLGVVFALIGAYEAGMMTGIPLTITLGSVAMMLVGVSLLVLSLGVSQIAKAVEPLSLEKAGMIALIIGGLGVGFAAAGFAAPLIILGAGAFLVAGGALILIAKGLQALTSINFGKLGSIDKTGSGAFNDSGETTRGFLGFFKRKKTNLEVAMEAIADSMSLGPASIFGIMAGAPTLMLAGAALNSIAKGLAKFDATSKKINLAVLSFNVSFMTSILAETFAKIGKKYPGGRKSLMASIFGGGKQSAVADGISSTMGMGGALSSIARGMQAMANLKFPIKYDKDGNPIEFETMASDAPQKVATNAAMITGVLAEVFGRIGKKYPGGRKGLFARIFTGGGGSPVADGISSVMGMGDALTGIAKGFQAMANLNFPVEWDKDGKPIRYETIDIKTSVPKVMENTKAIVTGLSGVFAEIGKDPNASRSWFFGRSAVQKGIDVVASIGTPLFNLAKGVQSIANLKFPTGFDKDGKATGYETIGDPGTLVAKVGDNTKLLVRALVETFTAIGKDDGANDGGFWWWQKSSFDKGVEIVKKIADPYKKLGEGIKTVIEVVGKLDSKTFAGKISDIIKVFTMAGDGDDLETIGKKATLIATIGATFDKMGDAIPAITTAINGYDPTIGEKFFGSLIGPVDEGARAEGYGKQATLWATIGANVVKMGESMPSITTAINEMDLAKVTELRTMFEALGVLSNGGEPADILASMGESLEEALENLAKMLEDFKGSVEAGAAAQTETGGIISTAMARISGGGQRNTSGGSGNSAEVVAAINQLQTTLVSSGIKVKKGSGGWFS